MKIENSIWYEKYRPGNIEEMALPKEIRKFISKCIASREFPHLLFSGPAGSGKTTLANIIISSGKAHCLVLNASSSDRGVATIKGKVKDFAASQARPGHLKFVFLDEADGLTSEAQDALKNTVEKYSKQTKFIFTANDLGRIIEPLRSRCMCFSFSSYPVRALKGYATSILEREEISFDVEDLDKLIEFYYPDVRSIVNNLQIASSDGKLNLKEIHLSDLFNYKELTNLIMHGEVRIIRASWAKRKITNFIWFYKFLFDVFIFRVPEKERADAALTIAEFLSRDSQVADKEINAAAAVVALSGYFTKKVKF